MDRLHPKATVKKYPSNYNNGAMWYKKMVIDSGCVKIVQLRLKVPNSDELVSEKSR